MTHALAEGRPRLRELQEAIAVLTAIVDAEVGSEAQELLTGGTPAEAALCRLLDRRGLAVDEQLLGFPIVGARLIALRAISPRWQHQLHAVLRADRDAVVVDTRDVLVVLVRNLPRRADADRGLMSARRLVQAARRIDGSVTAGISGVLDLISDLPAAFADAADAATIAGARNEAVVCVDDAWAEIVLERLRAWLPAHLPLNDPVGRLSRHDQAHGSELLRSLGSWLRLGQGAPQAASELGVHVNTLRYRLRRAADMADVDLSDNTQRLVVELLERCVRD